MAAEAMAQRLIDDTSVYALKPGRPEELRRDVLDAASVLLAGIPHGTLKADNNGVRYAAQFCLEWDTPFLRPLSLTAEDKPREKHMYAQFLVFCSLHMNPRSTSAVGADGKVITQAKPPSALGRHVVPA